MVLCPARHKTGHFVDISPSQSFGLVGKTKPNTTKTRIHQSKNVLQHKINTKAKARFSRLFETTVLETERVYSQRLRYVGEKISIEKVKKKDKWGSIQYKQANNLAYAPKSKIESRTHYASEPAWGCISGARFTKYLTIYRNIILSLS